jgi:hypothetical protein
VPDQSAEVRAGEVQRGFLIYALSSARSLGKNNGTGPKVSTFPNRLLKNPMTRPLL